MSAFEELGVMPSLITSLADLEWHLPRPVQTEAVPLILGGGDVAVAAETGAGKTGAFCIPILQIVYETLHAPAPARPRADDGAPIALSPVDRSRDVAVEGPLAQCRSATAWQGVRATRGVARGRWYFTARPDDEGLCRVGWSAGDAALNLGTDARGFGYGGTGMKSNAGKFDAYGETYGKGDVVTCLLAFDGQTGAATAGFLQNGRSLGTAFQAAAAGGSGADGALFPAVALKNAQVSVDFAESDAAAEALGYRPMRDAVAADARRPEGVPADADAEGVDGGGRAPQGEDGGRLPLALILEPSRELAEQVHVELEKLSSSFETSSVRRMLLVGGGSPHREASLLRKGVDIVAGTLGSVLKQVKDGALSLDNVRFFVLDEADTFATDNLGDVLRLHVSVPPRNQVQTLLFSATLHSPEIRHLSEKIQRFPTWIDLKGKEAIPDTVHHTLVRVDADADVGLVSSFESEMCRAGAPFSGQPFPWPLDGVHVKDSGDAADARSAAMKRLKLAALKLVIDANSMQHAMLFTRTQQDCDNLERFLLLCSGVAVDAVDKTRFKGSRDSGPEVEYSCSVLHGGRRADERRAALAAFRGGEVRFLICTDVAARGIDISGLPFLINVTLPDKSENYIHRVGRVGRSDCLGLAVSLVSAQKEAVWFHSCNKAKDGRCKNRKLVDAGGCVLWYNESKLLEEIEERLKGQVEELDSEYKRKGGVDAPPVLYGAMRDDAEMGAATAVHIAKLKPAVQELVRMEQDAQMSFLNLQARYPLVPE
jgi:ATP-dependent RNA helicase DDX1